ncbi:MAG: hypothetical protein D6718_03540 [Acidobacteria bacterium]|nr:MAG: hypothetical protein D6718_03540 [Acidobacteriota bacterium]
MADTVRVRLDRIASSTANARVPREPLLGPSIVCREGYVIAVRILTDKRSYNVVEDTSGRMVPLRHGDLLAGTLGSRKALKGYAGVVPEELRPGDTVHVLNLGGVLGRCTSVHPDLGPPFEAEVLGAVLDFPRTGDRIGRPAHIRRGAIPPAESLDPGPPIVFVAGTSMNSGKTAAAVEIIRGLTRAGCRVAGVKLTGVALRRDALAMQDAGALLALTFTDAGAVSTDPDLVLPVAKGLLNHLGRHLRPDIVVAELGDGILGEYGVQAILADAELMGRCAALVLCAPDQVGAWGGVEILRRTYGIAPSIVAGPATDTEVGCRYVRDALGLPAHNARRAPERLAACLLEVVGAAR